MRLHHIQVACPRDGEELARRFYGDGLGLTELTPARKAHPALVADDVAHLESVGARPNSLTSVRWYEIGPSTDRSHTNRPISLI